MPRPTSADNAALHARAQAYWRRNLLYLGGLLTVWALVSYGFGIVWADALNTFTLPGTRFPLGFWFAQQGSIYVFVVLIFVYVVLMNRLDREFDLSEEDGPGGEAAGAAGGAPGTAPAAAPGSQPGSAPGTASDAGATS